MRGEQELTPWAHSSLFSIDGQFPKLDVAGSSPVSRSKLLENLLVASCAPQKFHARFTQRFPRAGIHGGVRREGQRFEPYVPQEYDAGECSPARADVARQVFPAQGSCAASRD